MLVTLGTTAIIRKLTNTDPMKTIKTGYASAATTLPLSRACPSMKSARRSSTASSVPDSSPAATMFTYSGGNTLGCFSRHLAKAVPSLRLSRTVVRMR